MDVSSDDAAAQEANAHGAASNGSKVAQACQYCRHRRIRCDGASPCSSCASRSRPCEYPTEPPKKRGPKSRTQREMEAAAAGRSARPVAAGSVAAGTRPQQAGMPAADAARLREVAASRAPAGGRPHPAMPARAPQAELSPMVQWAVPPGTYATFAPQPLAHVQAAAAAHAAYFHSNAAAAEYTPPVPSDAAVHRAVGALQQRMPPPAVQTSGGGAMFMPSSRPTSLSSSRMSRQPTTVDSPNVFSGDLSPAGAARAAIFPAPSEREHKALELYFAQVNSTLAVVNKQYFYTVLGRWATGVSAAAEEPRMPRLWWCAHPQTEATAPIQRPDHYAAIMEGALGGGIARTALLPYSDRAQLAQYHACVAVGFRLLHGVNGRPPADAALIADGHFERARALAFSCMDEPTTTLVSTLLVMAHYSVGLARFTPAALFASFAWRLARACGLTVDDGALGSAARFIRQTVCSDLDPMPPSRRLMPVRDGVGGTARAAAPPSTTSVSTSSSAAPETPTLATPSAVPTSSTTSSTLSAPTGAAIPKAAELARRVSSSHSASITAWTSSNEGPPVYSTASLFAHDVTETPAWFSTTAQHVRAMNRSDSQSQASGVSVPGSARAGAPHSVSARGDVASVSGSEQEGAARRTQVVTLGGTGLPAAAAEAAQGLLAPPAMASGGMVRVNDDLQLASGYLTERVQELLGYGMGRIIHMRRGMQSRASRRELCVIVDEMIDILALPGVQVCATYRAGAFGMKSLTLRQAKENEQAYEWAQKAVAVWGSIPLMQTTHSFTNAFMARIVALIALSQELQRAVTSMAAGSSRGGSALSDPPHSSSSSGHVAQSQAGGASLHVAASTTSILPRTGSHAGMHDGASSVGDGTDTGGAAEAAVVSMPPLSEFEGFGTLALIVGTVANHWPVCARMYQSMMLEAGAMHRVATVALQQALHASAPRSKMVQDTCATISGFFDDNVTMFTLVKSVSGSLPDIPVDGFTMPDPDGSKPGTADGSALYRKDGGTARLTSAATPSNARPAFSHALPPLYHVPVDRSTGQEKRTTERGLDRNVHIMTSNLLCTEVDDSDGEAAPSNGALPTDEGVNGDVRMDEGADETSGEGMMFAGGMNPLDLLCMVIQHHSHAPVTSAPDPPNAVADPNILQGLNDAAAVSRSDESARPAFDVPVRRRDGGDGEDDREADDSDASVDGSALSVADEVLAEKLETGAVVESLWFRNSVGAGSATDMLKTAPADTLLPSLDPRNDPTRAGHAPLALVQHAHAGTKRAAQWSTPGDPRSSPPDATTAAVSQAADGSSRVKIPRLAAPLTQAHEVSARSVSIAGASPQLPAAAPPSPVFLVAQDGAGGVAYMAGDMVTHTPATHTSLRMPYAMPGHTLERNTSDVPYFGGMGRPYPGSGIGGHAAAWHVPQPPVAAAAPAIPLTTTFMDRSVSAGSVFGELSQPMQAHLASSSPHAPSRAEQRMRADSDAFAMQPAASSPSIVHSAPRAYLLPMDASAAALRLSSVSSVSEHLPPPPQQQQQQQSQQR